MTDAMEVDHVPENSTIQFDVQTIKKLHPKEYYRKFISQQIRPDGRGLRRFRKVQIVTGSVSSAEGSAMVKMGNTSVMCGIKAEVSTPPVNSPDIGYFVPNIELSPLCSSKFRPGPPSDMAQTLSAELNEMITKSKVVNLENLCIEEGLASWVIYADIYCLNYDGNIFDACLIALLAALKSARLAKATFYEDEGAVRATQEKIIPIALNRIPFPSTFTFFDRATLLADPTDEEEELSSCKVTVVLDESDRLCSISKPGGSKVSHAQIKECIEVARSRYQDLKSIFQDIGIC